MRALGALGVQVGDESDDLDRLTETCGLVSCSISCPILDIALVPHANAHIEEHYSPISSARIHPIRFL